MLLRTLGTVTLIAAAATPAAAWTIGSQLDYTGCHERITTTALRAARERYASAPVIPPTPDEQALIDGVQFVPPADFQHDLAAMSLLLGVRDNDLKGNNPLDSLQLVQVHGNPDTQEEHCIRASDDDGDAGDPAALERCRTFIHDRFAEALEGFGQNGEVAGDLRAPLAVWVSFAGRVRPELPQFYVELGQAVHALEDSFTHTYRTSDGLEVTTVMNWIDYVSTGGADADRDGPAHLSQLDDCESTDPLVMRNFKNANDAATALVELALDPALAYDAKLAGVDALLAKYLTYSPGCDNANGFCDAAELKVPATSSCNAGGGATGWLMVLALGAVLRKRRASGHEPAPLPDADDPGVAPPPKKHAPPVRRDDDKTPIPGGDDPGIAPPKKAMTCMHESSTPLIDAAIATVVPEPPREGILPPRYARGTATQFIKRTGRLAALVIALLGAPRLVHAQPAADQPAVPVQPVPTEGADAPAVPVVPEKAGDAADAAKGKEPGRDVKTPTQGEVEKVREAKRLGSPFGFAAALGGSVDHGAFAGMVGGRYRINERWVVGLDAEWNPWVTTAPWKVMAGTASVYATIIHRYPMKLDRVNLRTTLNLGVSTLLFDVYGAPKYDVGPFVGISPLGIDYDLGGSVRLVFDPLEVAVPVPHIGLIPLYYEQFRTMIGIQIGA